jgi:fatty acid/phospholipid biosynthesis enzyme
MILTFSTPQVIGNESFTQMETITQDYVRLITKDNKSRFLGNINGKNIYSRTIQTLVLTAKKDESDRRAKKRISL